MGGKEIQEIIKHLMPQLSEADRLVISPHRNILELRQFLNTSELGLVEEICLKDDGQYYQIMCLARTPKLAKVSLYGSQLWKGVVGVEHRKHQLRAFSSHQDPISKAYSAHLKQLSL